MRKIDDFILFKKYLKLGFRKELSFLSSFLLVLRDISYFKKYTDIIFYEYLKIKTPDLEYLGDIYGYIIFKNEEGIVFFIDISLNKFNYKFCDGAEMLKLIKIRKQKCGI